MKKEWIILIVIGVLLFALGFISAWMFFLKKNPALLRHKIKLGLLIISLQSLLYGCGPSKDTSDIIECYAKPAQPDMLSPISNDFANGVYLFNLAENDSLKVGVSDRQGKHYAYALVNKKSKGFYAGPLFPKDSVFDNSWEEMFAIPGNNVPEGDYELRLYNTGSSDLSPQTRPQATYPVQIKKQKL
jgi:hypothetical protein